jgi:hypothetical protein
VRQNVSSSVIHEDTLRIVRASGEEVMKDFMDDDARDAVDDASARGTPPLNGLRREGRPEVQDAFHLRIEDDDDCFAIGVSSRGCQNVRAQVPLLARAGKNDDLHHVRTRQ